MISKYKYTKINTIIKKIDTTRTPKALFSLYVLDNLPSDFYAIYRNFSSADPYIKAIGLHDLFQLLHIFSGRYVY